MRPAIYLSDAAYLAGGLDAKIKRILREQEEAERQHAEELKRRARERRAARKAAEDFSELA